MSDTVLECGPTNYPQLFRYKKNKRKKVTHEYVYGEFCFFVFLTKFYSFVPLLVFYH